MHIDVEPKRKQTTNRKAQLVSGRDLNEYFSIKDIAAKHRYSRKTVNPGEANGGIQDA